LRPPLQLTVLVLLAFATAAVAQTSVIQRENVRYEYAKVLRVTPVYQTLTATKTEVRCDAPSAEEESRIRRVVGAVRGAFRRQEESRRTCRSVPVEREFRRPIAYDVDYTYRGAKYRSRLAEDPGHLLRIRISVMPAP
jgi:uncharacterized protein YcfJ